MKYESFSGPEINDILRWVDDRDLVSLMTAQSPEGNHAPFFIAVVKKPEPVEPKPTQIIEPVEIDLSQFEDTKPPKHKNKGGRPKGSRNK